MEAGGPTLLLTRPEPQSAAFLAEVERRAGRRVPAVISPLMRIAPVGDLPDLQGFRTIVLTSANGVQRMAPVLAGRSVVTVGDRTAALARDAGADAKALGETAEALMAHAAEIAGPALVCRGVHARAELAARLRDAGIEAAEAVVYDQIALPLTTAARALLEGKAPVVAPLFSPRSATLLSANRIAAPLTVVAMSSAVAAAWVGPGQTLVASAPTAAAMAALVSEAF